MEVSDVRRRLRAAIEDAKRRTEERRAKKADATRHWERVLNDLAIPAFQQIAQALNAEGYRYKVETPASAVRLVPERGGEEFLELALDTDADEPALVIRSARGRGRRSFTTERRLGARSSVDVLTDNALVDELMADLIPLIER